MAERIGPIPKAVQVTPFFASILRAVRSPLQWAASAVGGWRVGGQGLAESLTRDGWAEDAWIDGPVGSFLRVAPLATFILLGFATARVWSFAQEGLPLAGWVFLGTIIAGPFVVTSVLWMSHVCGPAVKRTSNGLELGSASEGWHRVPLEDVARWARVVWASNLVYFIDLGASSPIATRFLVVSRRLRP